MATFDWDASMRVGVCAIDEQHAHMTNLINKLYYSFMDGTDKAILAETIDELDVYAKNHFLTEEKYMNQFRDQYPEYGSHIALHRDFFSKVTDFLFKFSDGEGDITPEMLDYLTEWWFNHIGGIDKRFGMFLADKGIA